MKVIMTYRNYYGMDRREIFPQIFRIKENENPEDALRRIWENDYNGIIADNLNEDINDPVDEENCWFEDDMALITWEDGDTKEFYVVEVEDYNEIKFGY